MFRAARAALLAAGVLALAPAAASATPQQKLSGDLGALWTKVFETPSAQNPFGSSTDPANECWDLGRTVAPFGPTGVSACTVTTGTKLFVVGSSFECSSIEGNGTTEAVLAACARANDAQVAPGVTVDGRSLPVAEVQTSALDMVLPADNIFGAPPRTAGISVAHGWVTLLHPLTPGSHAIEITLPETQITTIITVEPGR